MMVLTGEGGMGKSQVIDAVTQYFENENVPDKLAKGAYTGIAASLIGGKTLHVLFGLTVQQGGIPSTHKIRQLAGFWRSIQYLIIDEFSMVSQSLFARLSTILGLVSDYNNSEQDGTKP